MGVVSFDCQIVDDRSVWFFGKHIHALGADLAG